METLGLGISKTPSCSKCPVLHVLILKKCSTSRQALSRYDVYVMYIVTLFENHFASFTFLSNLRSSKYKQTSVRVRRGRK